jgi:3,4-dihydroxy 2-butanone 4-phosphate synthase/GTP cyclohydrolase II
MSDNSPHLSVPEAVEQIRAGRMVIVVDDEDRENEGDLTMAADMVTPEASTSWPATAAASSASRSPRSA